MKSQANLIEKDIVIIVSTEDIAGMNMLYSISKKTELSKELIEAPSNWPPGEYYLYETAKFIVLTIPESQIFTDYLATGISAKLLIFASKHSSAAGQKALLIHTTGNWQQERGHGGYDFQLAIAPADILRYAFQKIHEIKNERELDYWVGIECTHHGPTALDIPIMFIEAGGTIEEWQDTQACTAIADVILDTIDAYHDNILGNKPAFIGVGGNHYSPSFIKVLMKGEFSLGHIVPKYALDDLPTSMLQQAFEKTIAVSKLLLIDKKGTKSKHRNQAIEFAVQNEIEWRYT